MRRLVATGWSVLSVVWVLCGGSSASLEHTAFAQAQPRSKRALAVIVGAQSPIRDLPRTLLRRIFLGEPAELHGIRFVPFNYAPTEPLRRIFDHKVLGFDADAAGRYWIDRRIRGQGLPPRAVPTSLLMLGVVAKLPGAIGYVSADRLAPIVRALSIDGHGLDAPDYPL